MSFNTKKPLYIILCIVLLLSLATVAVIYHYHAIEDAYDEGENIGYTEGKSVGYENGKSAGYKQGYDEGYGFYEEIEDEYRFYHNGAVIVTTAGKKYHRYGCYHIRNRSIYIYNIENAKAKGYTSCLDCYD